MQAVSPDQFNSGVPSAQPHDVLPCGTGIASYEGGIRALFEENADAEVAKCHEKCGLFCPNASDRTFRTGGSHYARRSQGTVRHDRHRPNRIRQDADACRVALRNQRTVPQHSNRRRPHRVSNYRGQSSCVPGSGLTFATALRSFLRQDPDVIMVGEMGAAETALIGVHAALTGHLVPGCTQIPPRVWSRVIDRGVEGIPLASGIWGSGSALFVEALKAQPSAGARIRIDLCASR
jgi:Type II/IV secretion system protein